MTRILSLLALPMLATFIASCGCPQGVQPPPLPKEPKFKELPAAGGVAEEVPVTATK
ncbi:MAG: hypothetical protein R3242_06760 [Akkermansiaceae bacterium]|nr:hypothetical protein [Akkermansiaceae bacterium]